MSVFLAFHSFRESHYSRLSVWLNMSNNAELASRVNIHSKRHYMTNLRSAKWDENHANLKSCLLTKTTCFSDTVTQQIIQYSIMDRPSSLLRVCLHTLAYLTWINGREMRLAKHAAVEKTEKGKIRRLHPSLSAYSADISTTDSLETRWQWWKQVRLGV